MLAASASYSRSLLLQPQVPQTTRKLPELPAEVWRVVARATLAASDSSLSAWLRLSMVSRDWRQALKGAISAYLLPSALLCSLRALTALGCSKTTCMLHLS